MLKIEGKAMRKSLTRFAAIAVSLALLGATATTASAESIRGSSARPQAPARAAVTSPTQSREPDVSLRDILSPVTTGTVVQGGSTQFVVQHVSAQGVASGLNDTLTLPPGITIAADKRGGWTCPTGAQRVVCRHADAIPAGSLAPLVFTVQASATAPTGLMAISVNSVSTNGRVTAGATQLLSVVQSYRPTGGASLSRAVKPRAALSTTSTTMDLGGGIVLSVKTSTTSGGVTTGNGTIPFAGKTLDVSFSYTNATNWTLTPTASFALSAFPGLSGKVTLTGTVKSKSGKITNSITGSGSTSFGEVAVKITGVTYSPTGAFKAQGTIAFDGQRLPVDVAYTNASAWSIRPSGSFDLSKIPGLSGTLNMSGSISNTGGVVSTSISGTGKASIGSYPIDVTALSYAKDGPLSGRGTISFNGQKLAVEFSYTDASTWSMTPSGTFNLSNIDGLTGSVAMSGSITKTPAKITNTISGSGSAAVKGYTVLITAVEFASSGPFKANGLFTVAGQNVNISLSYSDGNNWSIVSKDSSVTGSVISTAGKIVSSFALESFYDLGGGLVLAVTASSSSGGVTSGSGTISVSGQKLAVEFTYTDASNWSIRPSGTFDLSNVGLTGTITMSGSFSKKAGTSTNNISGSGSVTVGAYPVVIRSVEFALSGPFKATGSFTVAGQNVNISLSYSDGNNWSIVSKDSSVTGSVINVSGNVTSSFALARSYDLGAGLVLDVTASSSSGGVTSGSGTIWVNGQKLAVKFSYTDVSNWSITPSGTFDLSKVPGLSGTLNMSGSISSSGGLVSTSISGTGKTSFGSYPVDITALSYAKDGPLSGRGTIQFYGQKLAVEFSYTDSSNWSITPSGSFDLSKVPGLSGTLNVSGSISKTAGTITNNISGSGSVTVGAYPVVIKTLEYASSGPFKATGSFTVAAGQNVDVSLSYSNASNWSITPNGMFDLSKIAGLKGSVAMSGSIKNAAGTITSNISGSGSVTVGSYTVKIEAAEFASSGPLRATGSFTVAGQTVNVSLSYSDVNNWSIESKDPSVTGSVINVSGNVTSTFAFKGSYVLVGGLVLDVTASSSSDGVTSGRGTISFNGQTLAVEFSYTDASNWSITPNGSFDLSNVGLTGTIAISGSMKNEAGTITKAISGSGSVSFAGFIVEITAVELASFGPFKATGSFAVAGQNVNVSLSYSDVNNWSIESKDPSVTGSVVNAAGKITSTFAVKSSYELVGGLVLAVTASSSSGGVTSGSGTISFNGQKLAVEFSYTDADNWLITPSGSFDLSPVGLTGKITMSGSISKTAGTITNSISGRGSVSFGGFTIEIKKVEYSSSGPFIATGSFKVANQDVNISLSYTDASNWLITPSGSFPLSKIGLGGTIAMSGSIKNTAGTITKAISGSGSVTVGGYTVKIETAEFASSGQLKATGSFAVAGQNVNVSLLYTDASNWSIVSKDSSVKGSVVNAAGKITSSFALESSYELGGGLVLAVNASSSSGSETSGSGTISFNGQTLAVEFSYTDADNWSIRPSGSFDLSNVGLTGTITMSGSISKTAGTISNSISGRGSVSFGVFTVKIEEVKYSSSGPFIATGSFTFADQSVNISLSYTDASNWSITPSGMFDLSKIAGLTLTGSVAMSGSITNTAGTMSNSLTVTMDVTLPDGKKASVSFTISQVNGGFLIIGAPPELTSLAEKGLSVDSLAYFSGSDDLPTTISGQSVTLKPKTWSMAGSIELPRELAELIGISDSQFQMFGTFTGSGFSLSAQLNSGSIQVGDPSFVSVNLNSFSLVITKSSDRLSLALQADGALTVEERTFNISGAITLEGTGFTAALTVSPPEGKSFIWEGAFGIQSFNLISASVQIDVLAGLPLFSLAFKGVLTGSLAKELSNDSTSPIEISAAVSLSGRSPCMAGSIGESGGKTVVNINNILTASLFKFYIAPVGCTIGTGSAATIIPRGASLQFEGSFLGAGVSVSLNLSYDRFTATIQGANNGEKADPVSKLVPVVVSSGDYFKAKGSFSITEGLDPSTFECRGQGSLSVNGYELATASWNVSSSSFIADAAFSIPGVASGELSGALYWGKPPTGATIANESGTQVPAKQGDFNFSAGDLTVKVGSFSADGSVTIGSVGGHTWLSLHTSLQLSAIASVEIKGTFSSKGTFSLQGNGNVNLAGFNVNLYVATSNDSSSKLDCGPTKRDQLVSDLGTVCGYASVKVPGGSSVNLQGLFTTSGGKPQFYLSGKASLSIYGYNLGESSFDFYYDYPVNGSTLNGFQFSMKPGFTILFSGSLKGAFYQGNGGLLFQVAGSVEFGITGVATLTGTLTVGNYTGTPSTSTSPGGLSVTASLSASWLGTSYLIGNFTVPSSGSLTVKTRGDTKWASGWYWLDPTDSSEFRATFSGYYELAFTIGSTLSLSVKAGAKFSLRVRGYDYWNGRWGNDYEVTSVGVDIDTNGRVSGSYQGYEFSFNL